MTKKKDPSELKKNQKPVVNNVSEAPVPSTKTVKETTNTLKQKNKTWNF